MGCRLLVDGYCWLSVAGCWSLVVGCWLCCWLSFMLLLVGCWLCCWLLIVDCVGCWSLDVGYWLSVVGYVVGYVVRLCCWLLVVATTLM